MPLNQSFGTDDRISIAVEKYADMVRRICFLYLKNKADVEDVFQEVFLKLILHADSFTDEQHEKAWLCRVTFNQCKDLCKSFWRNKVEGMENLEIPYESAEQIDLLAAVHQLPPQYKQILYLHFYERMTVPEIAAILKQNSNTIYTQLRRARVQLKKKLGEDFRYGEIKWIYGSNQSQ